MTLTEPAWRVIILWVIVARASDTDSVSVLLVGVTCHSLIAIISRTLGTRAKMSKLDVMDRYTSTFSYNRAFADRRGYLIMSLSRITTWPTWSLQLSEINNIMYAVKTLYRLTQSISCTCTIVHSQTVRTYSSTDLTYSTTVPDSTNEVSK